MDKRQILTDEELAMLRDLGDAEDKAIGQFLRGYLNLPLQSLLQRAAPLVLEARIAGHQLRFPQHCVEGEEGRTELSIAAPAITELSHPHLRPWRLDVKASLQTVDSDYAVHSLSVSDLIVEGQPSSLPRAMHSKGCSSSKGYRPCRSAAT